MPEVTLSVNSLGGESYEITVAEGSMVQVVKEHIARATGIPTNEQLLSNGTDRLQPGDVIPMQAANLTVVRSNPMAVFMDECKHTGNLVMQRALALREERDAKKKREEEAQTAGPSSSQSGYAGSSKGGKGKKRGKGNGRGNGMPAAPVESQL
mmetsp:Transcript_83518/g.145172  ORF Transcript_83518/g.145172 Transcript_83518/m.145172 type:complete len:153 (-) Transcript_83518:152-610(-)